MGEKNTPEFGGFPHSILFRPGRKREAKQEQDGWSGGLEVHCNSQCPPRKVNLEVFLTCILR